MKTMLIRSKNVSATEYYYDIIADALKRCSELVFDGFEGEALPDGNKDALVVVGSCVSMVRLWLKGYRRIATWYQGVLPEESFLRNKSRVRMLVLEWIECFALHHSVLQLFVSEAMREFYEKKYRLLLKNCYVMPCFNAAYDPQRVMDKAYDGKVFTYTGGLSKWQCINQTLQLYKRIEQASGNTTKLLLLTPEQDKARELVAQYGIVHAEISFVHYTKLPDILKDVSFGFVLREDNPVNMVATPTKFANYAANGIIPIYTSCVRDFAKASEGNPYQIVLQNANSITDDEIQQVLAMMDSMPSGQEAERHFGAYFMTYYNPRKHAQRLAGVIEKIEVI